jgi:syntaxin 18
MSDITPLFSTLLAQHSAAAIIPPRRKPSAPADEFLKEAYRIVRERALPTLEQLQLRANPQAAHTASLRQHLQDTRQSYLSTARPPVSRTSTSTTTAYLTDVQRDALDAQTKTIIRSTLSLISRLESAEKVRVQTEARIFHKKHSSLKSLWEDESAREREEAAMKMVAAHRESVIWFLKNRLEKASEEQRDRQEIRLQRQIERGKSLLHKAPSVKMGAAMVSSAAQLEEEERKEVEALSPDQLRIFEKENEGMLKHYEDTLEQVRYVSSRDYRFVSVSHYCP